MLAVHIPQRLAVTCPNTLFPPLLSFIWLFWFFVFFLLLISGAAITPAGSPQEDRPACTGLRSETDLLIYPLSFSFPRNVTRFILMTWRQTTTDRTWGKASRVLLYLLTALLEVLLGLVNQTCPLGFSAQEEKSQGGQSVCVCMNSCMQACACLLFSWLPLPYNMSQDYPTLFISHQDISLSFSLSPSIQTFYGANLFKHFRIFSGVIWERARLYQNTFFFFFF